MPLQHSHNTERALSMQRPHLRGLSHRIAFFVAIPAGIALIATRSSPAAALGALTYTIGMVAMFGASALVHLRPWPAATYERLFRLDHTGIYLLIAGTVVPLALLGLEGRARTALLVAGLGGTGAGIFIEWLPFAPPRGFSNAVYLVLGWMALGVVPSLWSQAGPEVVVLLLTGGVIYSVGAGVVGLQKPNPNPEVFGYHEIWHLMVIAAVAVHFVMIAGPLST